MPTSKQNPFVNSAKNYHSYEYINRDRSLPLIQERLTYATAGHLLETYVDALQVALLMDEPSFLIRLKDTPETIRNPTFIRATHRLPPHYVIEALGNYLESPSFFVKHTIGKPGEPARQDHKQPQSTQFAHETHAQLRQLGIRFAENVALKFFPPPGHGHWLSAEQWVDLKNKAPHLAVAAFKQAISDYKQLFKTFSDNFRAQYFSDAESKSLKTSAHLSPIQKKIIFDAFEASAELAQFNRQLEPIIDSLRHSSGVGGIKSVFVEYNGELCYVENKRLHPKFPQSTPALLIVALGYVGRHQVDRTFFPQQAFNFQLSVIGTESNVSDNIERLNQHILQVQDTDKGVRKEDLLFPTQARAQFVETTANHRAGIQFLHLFHKTAGILERIYPADRSDIAFQDMAQLLTLVGAGTEVESITNPREAATLLFAIERRFRATSVLKATLYNSLGEMLNKAGHLGRKSNFTEVSKKLRSDILRLLDSLESDEGIDIGDKLAITPATILIRKVLSQPSQ